MADNFWLGENELQIVYRNGTHFVLEMYEDYSPVFQGTYGDCRKYCERQILEYEDNLF